MSLNTAITTPTLTDPKMIDLALQELNTVFTTELTWLNHAFGKCERRVETEYQKKVIFPAVYTGENEYKKLFPDEHIGNFSFFTVQDGTEGTNKGRLNADVKATFSLIVWFDFEKVFPSPLNSDQYTTRNVITLFTEIFRTKTFQLFKIGSKLKFYEEGQNIYKGFTDKEVERQYLKRPFGGFRIEGDIYYHEKSNC